MVRGVAWWAPDGSANGLPVGSRTHHAEAPVKPRHEFPVFHEVSDRPGATRSLAAGRAHSTVDAFDSPGQPVAGCGGSRNERGSADSVSASRLDLHPSGVTALSLAQTRAAWRHPRRGRSLPAARDRIDEDSRLPCFRNAPVARSRPLHRVTSDPSRQTFALEAPQPRLPENAGSSSTGRSPWSQPRERPTSPG